METKSIIRTQSDDIVFGYWDKDNEEFIELNQMLTDEKTAEVAEILGCSPILVDALIMLSDSIAEAVGQDLKDIWKKVA